MTAIILRRRGLGRRSANGICLASTTGMYVVRNWVDDDVPAGADRNGYVFRWGCTSTLPEVYSARTAINTAKSIHWCADKRQGRLDMQAAGVSVPETWDVGEFVDDTSLVMAETFHEGLADKFVLRRSAHAQGRDLWVGNCQEISDAAGVNNVTEGYVSRLIDKTAEYRVFVCQGRVVWVAQKTPGNPDDVAWNVAQGGRFDNVRWGMWPMAVVEQALHAARVSGTDFSGVDVMEDAEGKAYVLEVNSAPSQTSPYRQQCVAKAFDWIVLNGKEHFPPVMHASTWRDVLHPALINRS